VATHLFQWLKEQFSILAVFYSFSSLKFWGRFEALKEIFLEFLGGRCFLLHDQTNGVIFSSRIYLSNEVLNTPNRDRMQKLRPREVDISTTPIGADKYFGFSSFGVTVLDFICVKNDFGASF
jgi:hypothetical protein